MSSSDGNVELSLIAQFDEIRKVAAIIADDSVERGEKMPFSSC